VRVGESPARPEPRATTAERFGDALSRAESRAAEKRSRFGPEAARRTQEPRRPALLEGPAAEGRSPIPREPAAPVRDELAPSPELAAVARAVPVAISSGRLADGAPLSLSFGRSLDVELRAGPAGVEVRLLPEPRLARAAEAELPRILQALKVRGVAVARAEVRPRGGGRAR
jgi:hypothetical protein